MERTNSLRSPRSFRLWAGISTIAAVLERRCYTVTDQDPLCPNLYTVLCGSPASGKSIAVNESRKLLAGIKGLYIGPDNPTDAAFKDSLNDASKISMNGSGLALFSAMVVLCREFHVLIPKYNDSFLADLADLYDNPPIYSSPRRSSTSLRIENPCVNILAASTPAALGSFPESAWGEGFTSRVTFIYGTSPTFKRDILKKRSSIDMAKLAKQLEEFFNELHGEFTWEEDANDAINHWYNVENLAPVPTYSRLANYNGRREVHATKLSMISAVSAGNGLCVTLNDFRRAQQWLFEAEKTMPDVFRAIMQKSDTQLLQDAHYAMLMEFGKLSIADRKAIDETFLWKFFEERAAHEKISGLIQTMEKTGRMRAGFLKGEWLPNPLV